jgi:hypothetical protein
MSLSVKSTDLVYLPNKFNTSCQHNNVVDLSLPLNIVFLLDVTSNVMGTEIKNGSSYIIIATLCGQRKRRKT